MWHQSRSDSLSKNLSNNNPMACSNAIHAVALAVTTVQPKIKLMGIEHNCWGAFSRLAGVMSSSGSDSDLKAVYMF
jgi:hypothetical protein